MDEGDGDEDPIGEDRIDGKFEEFHEELYVSPTDEGSSEEDRDEAGVLVGIFIEGE
jgi:hypothetical protein